MSKFKKGEHRGLKTEFKKGHIPWNKGKKCVGYNWGRTKGITPWNKGKKGLH